MTVTRAQGCIWAVVVCAIAFFFSLIGAAIGITAAVAALFPPEHFH